MSIDDEWPSLWDLPSPDDALIVPMLDRIAQPSIARVGDAIVLSYAPIPGAESWLASLRDDLIDVSCATVQADGSRTRYHAFFGPRAFGLDPGTRISSVTIQHHVMPMRITIGVR